MRMMPCAALCQCALRMWVGHVELRFQKLVRARERLQLNWAWKVSIIYTWLVKTLHNVLLLHFSCSLLALLASTVHWLCCFLFLNAANRRLHSVLDSAKHVCSGGPAALSYPSLIVKKRRSSLSSIARLGISAHLVSISPWVNARDAWVHTATCMWAQIGHFWVWQTRTYLHCENRSLIQNLTLMHLAITLTPRLSWI